MKTIVVSTNTRPITRILLILLFSALNCIYYYLLFGGISQSTGPEYGMYTFHATHTKTDEIIEFLLCDSIKSQ